MTIPAIHKDDTVSNAYAVRWRAGSNGNTFCLSNDKGSMSLVLFMREDGAVTQSVLDIDDPSRYGMIQPPASWDEFMTVAHAYIRANY